MKIVILVLRLIIIPLSLHTFSFDDFVDLLSVETVRILFIGFTYAYIYCCGIFRAWWLDDKFVKRFSGSLSASLVSLKLFQTWTPSFLVTKQNVFITNNNMIYAFSNQQPFLHFSTSVTKHVDVVPKIANLHANWSCAVRNLWQPCMNLISDSVTWWTGEQFTFSMWFWINNTKQKQKQFDVLRCVALRLQWIF